MPIGHVLVRVAKADFAPTVQFYTNALKTLGLNILPGFPEGMVGFGTAGPEFVLKSSDKSSYVHVAFQAAGKYNDIFISCRSMCKSSIGIASNYFDLDTKAVDAFHAATISAGAKDNGAPGIRAGIHPQYYAAFIYDPIGNNIEAGTLTSA